MKTTVYRPSQEESVSTAVVRAVADAKGTDAVELDDRLYDHVDPCALDRLFETPDGARRFREGRVSFTMSDCRVEIDGTRRVVVTPHSEPTTTPGEATP